MQRMILVADVGGTHARLALCHLDTGELSQIDTYAALAFPSLEVVIRQYLAKQQIEIYAACIAIACPITEDWVAMTNHSWAFSIKGMQTSLGLTHLEVINDFTAVSMAIPMLSTEDVVQLGGEKAQPKKPIAVYGAGTGLGVAHLVQVNHHWISLPGEGGHVDFAANTEQEAAILSILRAELGHVSAERILSGPGLANLYRALAIAEQRDPEPLSPQEITERALANSCPDCYRTLSLFCLLLGRFGGNLALNLATFGGVYIAGGIVPRFMAFLRTSGFRMAFEDKGRFKDYLRQIPVFVISHPQPGLLGAGAYLRQILGIPLYPK